MEPSYKLDPSTSEQDKRDPFAIEWYTSDTSGSIDFLHKKVVDVGITYHAIAEYTALNDCIIDRVEYVWRDHWMLVGIFVVLSNLIYHRKEAFAYWQSGTNRGTGPKDNPAELPTDRKENIYVLLTRLFSALEKNKDNKGTKTPIKFLSRYLRLEPLSHCFPCN